MITGSNQPSNVYSVPTITINVLLFFLIIALIIIAVTIIAYFCYHANDKKIEQLKKLIREPLTEQESRLITEYRNLNDQNKQVVDNAVKDLTTDNTNTSYTPLSKE